MYRTEVPNPNVVYARRFSSDGVGSSAYPIFDEDGVPKIVTTSSTDFFAAYHKSTSVDKIKIAKIDEDDNLSN